MSNFLKSPLGKTVVNYGGPGAVIGGLVGATSKKNKNWKERVGRGSLGAVAGGMAGTAYGHVFKSLGNDMLPVPMSNIKKQKAEAAMAKVRDLNKKHDKTVRELVDKKDQHRLPWAPMKSGKIKAAMISGFSDELQQILSR